MIKIISKEKLVKKLHFNKGLNISEVADILEESESEIMEVVDQLPKYKISTVTSRYEFWKLTDKDYLQLRKESFSIEPMYMLSYEMNNYLEQAGMIGIPEIYFALSYFFGETSKCYDTYKCSFKYVFWLNIYDKGVEDLRGEYIISIIDFKGNHLVEFYKIKEGANKEDYSKYHQPFPELKEREMRKLWFWFIAFVENGLEYIKDNSLPIKPFCRKIGYGNKIYGYKDEKFFVEEYAGDEENFRNTYESYQKDIAEQIEKSNYSNRSSEFISQIIKETNQSSMPSYEFSSLKYQAFRASYRYFRNKDEGSPDMDKVDSLTSSLVRYLAFKDEHNSKKEYFTEEITIRELEFEDFKKILANLDESLDNAEYTAEEIHQTLAGYREGFAIGIKEAKVRIANDLIEAGVGQLLGNKLPSLLSSNMLSISYNN